MAAIHNLPLEVLRSVLQYVSKKDLHALRLACHSINDIAASYLFCDLTVWLQRQSLERSVFAGALLSALQAVLVTFFYQC